MEGVGIKIATWRLMYLRNWNKADVLFRDLQKDLRRAHQSVTILEKTRVGIISETLSDKLANWSLVQALDLRSKEMMFRSFLSHKSLPVFQKELRRCT